MGMRQDHVTRPGEQREVQIGIEPTGGSVSFHLLKVITTVRVKLFTDPNEEVEDGLYLFVECRFARGECALPELRLIHQVEAIRDGQGRIEEELLQWSPPWRES